MQLASFVLKFTRRPYCKRLFHSQPQPPRYFLSDFDMSRAMSITFLGTSSGGGPSQSRNCSSLVADVLNDGSLWMVDCAEGTLRQFQLQPYSKNHLKVNKVTKMFITHMHADHTMGIVPILRNILYPPGPNQAESSTKKPPRIEIYGPAGVRAFIRTILKMTRTRTSDTYIVHELLTQDDELTPCDPPELMHSSEVSGKDIRCSPEDGFWRAFTRGSGVFGNVVVDAGPISHRDPCLGYIIREQSQPDRKIVILGDTHDPSSITSLCIAPAPSLLIHEATDAHIPRSIDPNARRSPEVVREKALSRGHSIPEMAGAFAKRVGAAKLVLNHIGGRFPAPRNSRDVRAAVMSEIERQASEAWGMGTAKAAWDFMRVVIPAPDWALGMDHQVVGTTRYADPEEGFIYPDRKRRWEREA